MTNTFDHRPSSNLEKTTDISGSHYY